MIFDLPSMLVNDDISLLKKRGLRLDCTRQHDPLRPVCTSAKRNAPTNQCSALFARVATGKRVNNTQTRSHRCCPPATSAMTVRRVR
jgi:hypothetical protein